MSKKCLTCIPGDGDTIIDTEKKIPEWYKKEGNYSLLPKILNSNDKYNANKNKLVRDVPTTTDTEVRVSVNVGKKNNWVFYWAADTHKNSTVIKNPSEAYAKHDNHGLLMSNDDGSIEFILNCPQPYKVDNITYPRHVHFVLLKEDDTWDMEVKTVNITCLIDEERFEEIRKSRDHIIINASLNNSNTLDGTINIPYDQVSGDSKKKLILLIKPEKELRSQLNDIDILDVPIIVYGSASDNEDSKILIKHLTDCGFSNTLIYQKGTVKKKKRYQFFESKKEDVQEDKVDLESREEKLIILKDNKKHEFIHDIYTDKLFIEKDNEKIYIGTWDGKEIKWDKSSTVEKIKEEYVNKMEGGEESEEESEKESEKESEEESEKESEEESEKESEEESEESEEESSSEEEPQETSDEESEEEESSSESEEESGGGGIDRNNSIQLQKLKRLLKGGGTKTKNEYKKESIRLQKKEPTINDNLQKNFRGWGYTHF